MALALASTTSPANWILDDYVVHPFAIGAFLPRSFDAYARIFHQIDRRDGSLEPGTSWFTIAELTGIALTPQTGWTELVDPIRDDPEIMAELSLNYSPVPGKIPFHQMQILVQILSQYTAPPMSCWIAVWDGFASLNYLILQNAPRIALPHRTMALLLGTIEDVLVDLSDDRALQDHAGVISLGGLSPNLWWPDDRSWMVATEIDDFSTYVAGSEECIRSLLSEPSLDAIRVGSADVPGAHPGVGWPGT